MPAGSLRGSSPGGGTDLEVRVDPQDFARLMRGIRGFDKDLATRTRARLRVAASDAVKGIRAQILSGESHSDTGLRKGLAAGTKLSIRAGARGAGVSIVTTGAKLPAAKQPMVRAYDKESFRHRVYGRDVWVSQAGRPYFGTVIDPRRKTMQDAMQAALDDAVKEMEGTVAVV